MKITFINSNIPINTDYIDKDTVLLSLNYSDYTDNIQKLIPAYFPQFLDGSMDMWYHAYIMQYDDTFLDLMKIIYPLYLNKNVIIIVDYFMNDLVESLIELLYQRYGLLSCHVQDIDDFKCTVDCDFSIVGLTYLDIDKQRMAELQEHIKPINNAPIQQHQAQLYKKI